MKSNGLLCNLFVGLGIISLNASASNWPSWRGPNGDGTSPETNAPVAWSANENVRWKTPLPEGGDSTPIVWGNRIFLTQALESEGRRTLMCFDRTNGKLLWQKGVEWKQPEPRYGQNSFCAASPVTDGERVIAFFGSAGLVAWSMDGQELWRRDLGHLSHVWGYASSPVIHGELCYLYAGPGPNSRLVALDRKTGKDVWEYVEPSIESRPRTDGFAGSEKNGIVCTFSTPSLVKTGNREELIQIFPQQVRALDPSSGKLIWSCDGLNELVYTSPMYANGVLIANGGYFGNAIGIKADGTGDVTRTHRLWQSTRVKNRIGSGVTRGDYAYVIDSEGIAECLEIKTGVLVWQERVKGAGPKSDTWSSMVLAGDRIYLLNQSGDTIILRASPTFEQIGVNSIGNELTNASTVISDGEIFIRTHHCLWCIGTPPKTASR